MAKTDFDAKLSSLHKKIAKNETKHLLVKNELKKIWGKNYFEKGCTQNYLVFQLLNKYFKVIANTNYVSSWKSKGLSGENITALTASDYNLNLQLSYFGTKARRLEFRGSRLKQD